MYAGTRRPLVLVALAVMLLHREADADAPWTPGDGPDALPAAVYVPIATPMPVGVSVLGMAGYGYTEGVLEGTDQHNRAFGSLALSARPLSWLAFGVRFDGRYDWHVTSMGNEAGAVGEPRLYARAAYRFGLLGLGLQALLWAPSQDAPSVDPGAFSAEFTGLVSLLPQSSPLAIGLQVGYRIDNSANSAPNAAELSPSQRLSLEVSSFNAVLMGLAAVGRVGPLEILGEWRWDLLVGTGAPGPLVSPMHVRAGVRWLPIPYRELRLGIVVDVCASERPDLTAGAPLVPVDPRASVMLTLGLRFPFNTEPPHVIEASTEPASREPVASAPPPTNNGSVAGRVTDSAGSPVPGASVQLNGNGVTREASSGADGRYQFDHLPAGQFDVTVNAEGQQEVHHSVRVNGSAAAVADAQFAPALPSGQLQGSIRSFSGEAVHATIRIRELNLERSVGDDGTFLLDVAPGDYTVQIIAPGYEQQRRPVHVDLHGVTVLNVDLRRSR